MDEILDRHQSNLSTLLQFAAKFHELTMQASLVEVLLCIIRTEAAIDTYHSARCREPHSRHNYRTFGLSTFSPLSQLPFLTDGGD